MCPLPLKKEEDCGWTFSFSSSILQIKMTNKISKIQSKGLVDVVHSGECLSSNHKDEGPDSTPHELVMVVQVCNLSIWTEQTGRPGVQCHLLHRESEARLNNK